MQSISNKTNNINANTKKSEKMIAEMKRKEKMVNFLLYLVSFLLLASDGLCFYLFHHYVKPSE